MSCCFPPPLFQTHFQPAPPAPIRAAPAAEEGQPHRGAFAWLEKQWRLCKHVGLIPNRSQITRALGAVANTQLGVPSCRNSSSDVLLHHTERHKDISEARRNQLSASPLITLCQLPSSKEKLHTCCCSCLNKILACNCHKKEAR